MKRDTAPERRNQLIYQRARGRAVTRLIRAHADEYDALFAAEKANAEAEAAALDVTAATKRHGDEPARLKSGRKARGQTVLDRIDVARCPHCIAHHDRGHTCTVCGARPGTQPPTAQPSRSRPQAQSRPRRSTTVDPAALAEFNAGTQRAAKASRR